MEGPDARVGAPPRVLLVAAGVLGVAVAGWLGVVVLSGAEREQDTGREAVAAPVARVDTGEALAALRAWDGARARAWAAGDATALRSLYTAGSAAGRRDREMLAAWRSRGLRVEGMRTQVLAASVDTLAADRIVLTTTDRLAGATAVGSGRRVALPTDRATTRRVTLRLVGGSWRVVSVVAVDPPRTTGE